PRTDGDALQDAKIDLLVGSGFHRTGSLQPGHDAPRNGRRRLEHRYSRHRSLLARAEAGGIRPVFATGSEPWITSGAAVEILSPRRTGMGTQGGGAAHGPIPLLRSACGNAIARS